jgi:hypothetical protein
MHGRVALTHWLMIIDGVGQAPVFVYDNLLVMIINCGRNVSAGGIDALMIIDHGRNASACGNVAFR